MVLAVRCGIVVERILHVVLVQQFITLDNTCGGMHLTVLVVEVGIVVKLYEYVLGYLLSERNVQAAVLTTVIAVQVRIVYGVVVDRMDMMQDMSLIVVHIVQNQTATALHIQL